MPRFVDKSLPVFTWVTHRKTEIDGFLPEPGERRRRLEFFAEWLRAWRRDIDGPACVVLAEPGRRIDVQNTAKGLTGFQFPANQIGLILDAAKTRDHQ